MTYYLLCRFITQKLKVLWGKSQQKTLPEIHKRSFVLCRWANDGNAPHSCAIFISQKPLLLIGEAHFLKSSLIDLSSLHQWMLTVQKLFKIVQYDNINLMNILLPSAPRKSSRLYYIIQCHHNDCTSQCAVAWFNRPQGPPSGVWTGHKNPKTIVGIHTELKYWEHGTKKLQNQNITFLNYDLAHCQNSILLACLIMHFILCELCIRVFYIVS